MGRFPLLWGEQTVGELTTEQEPLYVWFTACCCLPEKALWCAWVIGDRGELRLGVLEPTGKRAEIRRRFSERMTAPLGRVLRGEIRPVSGGGWEAVQMPDQLFRTPWLRHQLRGQQGAMTRREGEQRCLAIPYNRDEPFPLTALFCFARVGVIGGKHYAIFAFDQREWPVFL